LQDWQDAIQNTVSSGPGCFQAAYPSTVWLPTPCAPPPSPDDLIPTPPSLSFLAAQSAQTGREQIQTIGGGGTDYVAIAQGGPISSATGSFPSVTGINYPATKSTYSLQLNTNFFALTNSRSALCGGNACSGWVQFAFQNTGTPDSTSLSAGGDAHIEYWILNAPSGWCPHGWQWMGATANTGAGCYVDLAFVLIPRPSAQWIYNLNSLKVTGQTGGGRDTIIMTIGGRAYSANTPSVFSEFPQSWTQGQFNVFGFGDGSQLIFNPGSQLTVNLNVNNGTPNAPVCQNGNFTAESTNLNLNSPCCAVGGAAPSITYAESTTAGQNTTCQSLGLPANYTITASAGPGGSINPLGAISVASGTTRVFTLAPNSGYQVSSVGGTCGGTLNGTTYTTNSVTGNCTVTATFAPSAATYTVTATAGIGGSIYPSGALSTASGSTRTFTITPISGYAMTSVGGTCGGTLSGNTYTTNPITANCTVGVGFLPVSYTVTASAGAGGSISPSGTVFVISGTTFTFTVAENPGYGIYNVTGSCPLGTFAGNWISLTYTIGPLTADCNFNIEYKPASFITASAGAGGSIDPSGSVLWITGTSKPFTLTPNAGYRVASVGGTCGGTLNGNTYVTNAIPGNCTVTAAFTKP
jgi:hypothetical protein